MTSDQIKFLDHLTLMYRLTQMSGQTSTTITIECLRKIIETLAAKLDSETIDIDVVSSTTNYKELANS